MKKFLKKSAGKLANTILREGALLALVVVFSCIPLQAVDKTENGGRAITKKLSTLSLQDKSDPLVDPIASKKAQDAFSWQNTKHYEAVVKIFEDLADRELNFIIKNIIETIAYEKDFFVQNYGYMISHLRTTVYEWMVERVLTEENYSEQCGQSTYSSSTESDEDEDSWRRAFMRGYDGESDDSRSDNEEYSTSYEDDYYLEDQNEYEQDQEDKAFQEDKTFQVWKVDTIQKTLGLNIDSIGEFTEEDIDINAIKIFLKNHCRSGNMRYGWLLNQIIEGDLSTSEDFVSLIFDKTQDELVKNIKKEKGLEIISKRKSKENWLKV